MAKRKSNAAADLMAIVAHLPWWGGVILAVVSYFILHRFAATPLVTGTRVSDFASVMTGAMVFGLANVGQYLIPGLCLAGAVVSAWRRKDRAARLTEVAGAAHVSALNGMSWREFEMLTGEAFRQQGYAVVETGGDGPDGGIDLVLRKDGEKFYVQCKQWRACKVGVQTVRELFGVMAAKGATGGFVVTSGTFTKDAVEFASGRNLRLIGGQELFGMIQRAKSTSNEKMPDSQSAQQSAISKSDSPSCPICSSAMIERIAKRGARSGERFSGCTNYPACKGTRAIATK